MAGAERDRLTSARIAGITRRHARARALTGVEEAAVLAELAEVAHGRVDLLAQEAGLAIGFHGQDIDAPMYLQIAQLCIKAGADTALISHWIEEGQRRAAAVRQTPFTG
jgi:predicted urease superfamily metal-dependent hydrolase